MQTQTNDRAIKFLEFLEDMVAKATGKRRCPNCGRYHLDGLGHKSGVAVSIDQINFDELDPELGNLIRDFQSRGGPKHIHWWNDTDGCAYSPYDDTVTITEKNLLQKTLDENKLGFTADEQLRRLILHELAHSTGHKSRLNRSAVGGDTKSDRALALEEVIAERGAQIILKEMGMLTKESAEASDTYIKNFSRDFERFEGMTLGEVRMEAEPFAVAAAEHILGRVLPKRKAKAERELQAR